VLSKAGESFAQALPSLIKPKAKAAAAAPADVARKQVNNWSRRAGVRPASVSKMQTSTSTFRRMEGATACSVVIAAITSCTNSRIRRC